MSLRRITARVHRIFGRAFSDLAPRIMLSNRLAFRVFSDRAALVDLSEAAFTAELSRISLRALLDSIQTASASGQIQTVNIDDLTIEIDGRPQKHPLTFDENPFRWLWKPALVASAVQSSIDYVRIDISGPKGHMRDVIQKSKLEPARAALAKLDASRDDVSQVTHPEATH